MLNSAPYKPNRQYLSVKFDPYNKNELIAVLNKLTDFPPLNFKEANHWFGLFHELSCAVSEAHSILEINFNIDNSDKDNEKRLLNFEQNILTLLLNSREKMMEIYLNSPFKYSMHSYENGRIENEIIAKKNFSLSKLSSLQIEESKIIREYKKQIQMANTEFDGKNISLSALIGKTHDQSSKIRKDSFFSYWSYLKKNETQFQDLFDQLLENRKNQASIANCAHYTQLAFAELGRFDYGEKECEVLRNSILNNIVPIISELSTRQTQSLNETSLSPWNSAIWPSITPQQPLKTSSMENLFIALENVMTNIHPSFGKLFKEMNSNKLIDILPRKNKAPGAFSVTLQERGASFLFGNFGVNTRDLLTFIHEFGHCLHGYAVSNIPNILLRQPGFEFCEVASIGLELLSNKFFAEFWPDSFDAQKAIKYQFFQMLQFWPFMSMIDQWQHEIYSSGKFLTAKERNGLWLDLSKKYKPHIDWSACPEFEELGWLSRPHIFTSPFYFIDYGIAQIGALQLWLDSKQNYSAAVNKYIRGLTLGSQLSLPKLFQEIGVQFDFSEKLINKLGVVMLNEINQ